MRAVTESQMRALRVMREEGFSMAMICQRFQALHDRETVVEMIDAQHRHPDLSQALAHVNRVLTHQAAGWQLVNGRPISAWWPAPMF